MLSRTDFPFSIFGHEMTCFSCYVGNRFSVPMHHSFSIMLCFTISQSNSHPGLREPSNLILNLAFIFQLHSTRLIMFFQISSKFWDLFYITSSPVFLVLMDELCRLDLLINLQQEAFKELLEKHVSFILLTVFISISWFSFLS